MTKLCSCGKSHESRTKCVKVASGAVDALESFLAENGLNSCVMSIYDRNTKEISPLKIKSSQFVFKDEGIVSASSENLELIKKAAPSGTSALIAVGSGTINDLVKTAASELGVPYISVATAASMDGYLSANAAILSGGVKKAVNGLMPPLALFADSRILAEAPAKMSMAGLGDALGKLSSMAEWKINHIIRNEYYCQELASSLEPDVKGLLDAAEKEDPGSLKMTEAIMTVLLATGLAMQKAGNSFPASCGEHYISHAMEMRGYALHGHAPSMHGLQVAWGTKIMTELYSAFKEDSFRIVNYAPTYKRHIEDWKKIGVDISGTIEAKLKELEHAESRLRLINEDACRDAIKKLTDEKSRLERIYRKFDMPVNASDIGLSDEEACFAVEHAVDIRARICLMDIMNCLGQSFPL